MLLALCAAAQDSREVLACLESKAVPTVAAHDY